MCAQHMCPCIRWWCTRRGPLPSPSGALSPEGDRGCLSSFSMATARPWKPGVISEATVGVTLAVRVRSVHRELNMFCHSRVMTRGG